MTSPCHMYIASQRIQELLEAFFMFFKYKKRYLMVSNKIIYYSCEDGIEKCITRDHNCHHSASLVMPNGDLRDGLFYLTLTLMICSFIIPHVNSPYKTSIDERLIFYNITRCYSDGEYCHSFTIAAGDIVKYQSFV